MFFRAGTLLHSTNHDVCYAHKFDIQQQSLNLPATNRSDLSILRYEKSSTREVQQFGGTSMALARLT